ncbi:hypothetical protein LCGC14_2592060 [marine sediment metagenome]|uniref:Uncharacterized protein n=1 Tax=marine sediment metagenome TaxID=412755 RepID=A0A0F9CMG0_9ZZZZ
MQAVRVMGGNPFHILDLKLSATVVIGQPVLAGTGATPDGEVTDPASTTDYTDMAGLVLAASSFNPHGGGGGTLTYSTTQSDTEGLVRVVVNPNLIISAKLSGGATDGTALTTYTAAAAVSAGTSYVDADASTSMLEGTTWAITPNNNIGQSRRVTTHATGRHRHRSSSVQQRSQRKRCVPSGPVSTDDLSRNDNDNSVYRSSCGHCCFRDRSSLS